jgi:hypothetical protein
MTGAVWSVCLTYREQKNDVRNSSVYVISSSPPPVARGPRGVSRDCLGIRVSRIVCLAGLFIVMGA